MKRPLLILFLICYNVGIFATNYTSNGSGNWSSSSTWSPSGVPGASDNVTISGGDAVTLSANASCNNITITGSDNCLLCLCGCPNSYLDMRSYTLNVAGNFTSNADLYYGTSTLNLNGSGAQTLSGGLGFYNLTVNKSGGTATLAATAFVTNQFTVNSGTFNASTYTFNGAAGVVMTGGEFQIAKLTTAPEFTGTYSISGGKLTLNGAGAQTLKNGTWYDVNFAGSGTKSLNGTTTVTNDLTVAASVTLDVTASNYTINIGHDWTNNGTFTYRSGLVNFNGTANQALGGSSNTTFYKLTINKASGATILSLNTTVNNILTLTAGALQLNTHTLTINNSSTSAISTTSGYIVSEDNSLNGSSKANDNSKVQWNTGASTGTFVFPFATSGGVSVHLTITISAGSVGNLTVATYPTIANNTPYPITVSNVYNTSFVDNSVNVVDRFWELSSSVSGYTAAITFTYANAEIPGNGELGGDGLGLRAQRWNGTYWPSPAASQVFSAAANTVTISNVANFAGPWTLALHSSPLPVKMVYFKGEAHTENIQLDWATATEINNDHFEIEKSFDGKEFKTIGKELPCEIKMNCTYSFFDNSIINTLQYYRIKQVDRDGHYEYSNIISVQGGSNAVGVAVKDNALIVNIGSPADMSIELYNASGDLEYKAVLTPDFKEDHFVLPVLPTNGLRIIKISSGTTVINQKVIF